MKVTVTIDKKLLKELRTNRYRILKAKFIKWWRVWSGYIDEDFTPLRCLDCSYFEFTETVKSVDCYVASEIEISCAKCGCQNAYWAYGAYQPIH